MFKREVIEEIILGMADIVEENRMLRKQVEDLTLDKEIHYNFIRSMCGSEEARKEHERLSAIQSNNASVDLADSCGWSTSAERIPISEAFSKGTKYNP